MKQLNVNAVNLKPLGIGSPGIAHNVHRQFLRCSKHSVERIPCFGRCEVAVVKKTEIAFIGGGVVGELEAERELRLFVVSRLGVDPIGAIA